MSNETTGFYINQKGDKSAGILPNQWQLIGSWYFDDEDDLNGFKEALITAFWEYSAEDISIETFEEVKQNEDKLLKDLKP